MTPEERAQQMLDAKWAGHDHLCFRIWRAVDKSPQRFCLSKTPPFRTRVMGLIWKFVYATPEQVIEILRAGSFNHELFETFEAIIGEARQTNEQVVDMLLICCE